VVQFAISGLIYGGAYAMLGVCLVVMFRMVRVLNFAQAAIGAFGAYVAVELSGEGWSYVPAAFVGALAAGGIAAICGVIMASWFAEANTERRSTVAIAMFIALLTIGFRVFGHDPKGFPDLLPGETVKIGGVVVTIASIVLVVATIAVALAVALFLKRTRLGVRLRAQSERPQTAELLGVPARWLAVGVWAITGMLAAVGTLIVAPTRAADFLNLGMLIIPAIAAAAIGLFRSTGLAVVGGVGLGLIQGLLQDSDTLKPYAEAVPLVLIVVVLLWSQRSEVWDAAR
jgi:branched-chain amino acid transport system permease protein